MAKNNLKQIICNFAIQIKHKQIMRKFYTAIAIVAMAFTAQAQTALNVNGSLEDWTDGTTGPEGWFFYDSDLADGKLVKVEGDAADGNISVMAVSPESGRQDIEMSDITVVEGTTYTASYWYKTGDTIRYRFWGQWRGTEGSLPIVDGDAFQNNDEYIETPVGEWTQVTLTSTAPEGATTLRTSFRNYNNGGDLYIDNVIIYEGTASVKDNNIEGLNIYPNPANDLVNVVSSSLSNKDVVITNLLGKTVLRANVNQTVNISSLSAGVYMMQITQDGKSATRKLIVK